MISVILPVYEREDAVKCCLAALECQTLPTEAFELIVVDDSVSDAVADAIGVHSLRWGPPTLTKHYLRSSPPRVGSFTAGRARNIGAANAKGDLLVFIDQDVMLAPDALLYYAKAHKRYGDNTIIVGLYHWLPRMDFGPEDVRERFYDIEDDGFHDYECASNILFEKLPMDEPGIQGRDCRANDFGEIDNVVNDAALGAFSGNIGYPRRLFLTLGGFDENIRGHGGEDADLGLTAKTHGAKFLLYKEIWGLHRWHGRNQGQNALEVQANIEYIDKKHGVGQYATARRFGVDAQDWRDVRHYRKEAGGVLIQVEGDPTIWACRDGHRIGLPTPEWVTDLGFVPGQVLRVPPSGLNSYADEGVAGG
jgi:GT2 family glycosyltransferase